MPIGNTTLPNLAARHRNISISTAGLIISGSVIISGSANTITLSGAATNQTPATQTFVTTQVSNLVDSAPAALDTLNELAAAIGDDANYATTISTALGNRLRIDTNSQGLTSTQQGYGRTNLGLGTAATTNSTAYATAAQGTYADAAYSWGNHALAGYLTSFSEADTLDSVTGRGASTSNLVAFTGKITLGSRSSTSFNGNVTGLTLTNTAEIRSLQSENAPALTWHYEGIATRHLLMNSSGEFNFVSPTNENSGVAVVKVNGNTVWHAGNLTNLNQLTNGPGYLTSYSETDTLASVTSRGATTSTAVTLSSGGNTFNGHHYFSPYDSNGNHYPHYNSGANNNGSKLNLRMFDNSGNVVLFYLNGSDKSIQWNGNTIWHAGNDGASSGLDADLLDGNHASAFATAAQGAKADTAYGWGNHASAGYLTSQTSHADVVVDGDFTSNGLMKRTGAGTYAIVTDNSSNWNTAYGWGNHASAGYLTSFSETDTLDSVTDRGSSTTNNISIGALTTSGKITVGTFANSTTNSGEAWLGRAADRVAGTLTVQLGSGTGRKFEVVDHAWTTVEFSADDSGVATAAGSFRAPVFYDSDDTNYYLNPASTAYSSYNAGGARFRNIDISNSTYTDTIQNVTPGGNIWINYGHNGNVGLAYGGGYTTAYQSMRSPIFYDSANTSYYVDPASTSNLAGLTVANTITGNISGNAATATNATNAGNADTVDGYHAAALWRSDGGVWNPSANITLGQTAPNQEWSFDITRNGYTGGYWQVWDSSNSTMLKVDAVTGKVSAPYNFVGALEGNATSATSAATWTTGRTITIGSTGKSVNGAGNVSWTLSEIGAATAAQGSNADTAYSWGNHTAGGYAMLDHIRSLGTTSFSGTATTAGLISEMENDGAFDSYTSVFKTSWSYAGNFDLSDAGRFTETAGSSWITWTDDSSDSVRGNITALVIAPNTGGSAGGVHIYNDQGSGYAPGWREVWTSATDGAGSGLDADLLDGNHASAFATAAQGAKADTAHGWGNHASAGYLTSVTNISGNAATATTADQIDGQPFRNTMSNSAINADTLESNGITYYTSGVTNFSGNATDGALYSQAYSSAWQHQIAGDYRSGQIALRGKNNGTWQSWRTVLDSTNFSTWAATAAQGTKADTAHGWGNHASAGYLTSVVNISGNAATATSAGNSDTLDGYHETAFVRLAPNSSTATNGTFAIGSASSRNFIQSHVGQPLDINPLGNSIYIKSFIDYDNSNYYVDPDGTTSLNSVYGNEIYANNWFRNVGSNEGLYNETTTQHWSSNTNGLWDASSTTNATTGQTGIRLYAGGHVNTLRGYLYSDGDGFGLLNNQGGWSVRAFQGTGYGGQLYGSWRVPLLYDSDDTNYYIDPASTSIIGNVRANGHAALAGDGYGYGFWNGYGGSDYSIWMSAASNGTYGGQVAGVASNNDYNMYFKMNYNNRGFVFIPGSNTPVFQIANEGILIRGSVQSNQAIVGTIFYDANNTGYYVDPASTSNLVGLTVANTISGNISGNAATATTATSAGTATSATNSTNIAITDTTTTNATFYPTFVSATSGNNVLRVDSSTLTWNPSTNTLTAANLTGTATQANTVGITDDTAGAYICYPLFIKSATSGYNQVRIDSTALSYRPDTNILTAGTFNGKVTSTDTRINGIAQVTGSLHIRQTSNVLGSGIRLNQSGTANYWDIFNSGSTAVVGLNFRYNGTDNGGYILTGTNVANIDFTGQHRSISNTIEYSTIEDITGLIVISDGTYSNLNNNHLPQINEALPNVSLSNHPYDKRVFGVISDTEDNNNGVRHYAVGAWVSTYEMNDTDENRLIINSLGEGGMWVCNENGILENGDYITTSTIPGYGMKQNDDLLHNYTVAKITEDCLFNSSRTIDFEFSGSMYKKQFVGVTYHCG